MIFEMATLMLLSTIAIRNEVRDNHTPKMMMPFPSMQHRKIPFDHKVGSISIGDKIITNISIIPVDPWKIDFVMSSINYPYFKEWFDEVTKHSYLNPPNKEVIVKFDNLKIKLEGVFPHSIKRDSESNSFSVCLIFDNYYIVE